VLFLLILSSALAARVRGTIPQSRGEQSEFDAEERVQRPVRLPEAVVQRLRQDDRVRDCLQGSDGEDIAPWFTASAIDLNDDGLPDLVVKPENACLFGANIVPFWIFRNTAKGYELLLNPYGLALKILRTGTKGYRDITIEASSATTILGATYKFDGTRYTPRACWEQAIDEDKRGRAGKITYKKCFGTLEKPYR